MAKKSFLTYYLTKPIAIMLGVVFFAGMILAWINSSRQRPEVMEVSQEKPPITSGRKFAFVSHATRSLNDEEIAYLAANYDLLVVGNQTKPMDEEARKLKELNPAIKILVYFPTSIRHKAAVYGVETFKPEWYLKDSRGEMIYKGSGTNLAYIDLTIPEYLLWARQNINRILRLAPYDGLLFDNANPLATPRLNPEKMSAWNESLKSYLRNITNTQNRNDRILIFNGIHRAPSKTDRSISQLDITNGVLNEGFCYGQNNNGGYEVVQKELQVEDIELQLRIGEQRKYVMQKVNIPEAMLERYAKYCYGIFLMGDVPGYTYFKYGQGYNLNIVPNEYRILFDEYKLDLGKPISRYQNNEWLLSRQFENYFVVTNLTDKATTWINPRDRSTWQVPPKDSLFVKIEKGISSACASQCMKNGASGGWCAFQDNACIANGGYALSEGNASCPSNRGYCCCR